ncbi:hypothetical protein FRC12_016412 [Ceratobasidium sp. 428]|nr:hypothetical protein FRC12_016412 [Ceratobasidium sp. 428]
MRLLNNLPTTIKMADLTRTMTGRAIMVRPRISHQRLGKSRPCRQEIPEYKGPHSALDSTEMTRATPDIRNIANTLTSSTRRTNIPSTRPGIADHTAAALRMMILRIVRTPRLRIPTTIRRRIMSVEVETTAGMQVVTRCDTKQTFVCYALWL